MDDNSAERELLKAIEGGLGFSPAKEEKAAPVQKEAVSVENKLSNLATKFTLPTLPSFNFTVGLEELKSILTVITLVLVLWMGITLFLGVLHLENLPNFNVKTVQGKESAAGSAETEFPLAGYTYYADVILGRNIFKIEDTKKSENVNAGPRLTDLVKNLKIAGLSLLPETGERFAMIEDTSTGITYFLKEGDTLLNFNVSGILPDSVVLKYGNDEIKLR
jgi:hypothetical protein